MASIRFVAIGDSFTEGVGDELPDGTVRIVRQGESVFASHDEFEDEAEETSRAAREYAEQASSIRA